MTDATPKVWIIGYDISDPGRLRRVYLCMRGWGDHLQYSLFRCVLSPKQLMQLKGELTALIHHQDDQVVFIPVGAPDTANDKGTFTLGQPLAHVERICHVIG